MYAALLMCLRTLRVAIPILISHFCMTALYKFRSFLNLHTLSQTHIYKTTTHTQLQNVHFFYSNKVAPIQYWSVLTTLHSSDSVVSTLHKWWLNKTRDSPQQSTTKKLIQCQRTPQLTLLSCPLYRIWRSAVNQSASLVNRVQNAKAKISQ